MHKVECKDMKEGKHCPKPELQKDIEPDEGDSDSYNDSDIDNEKVSEDINDIDGDNEIDEKVIDKNNYDSNVKVTEDADDIVRDNNIN